MSLDLQSVSVVRGKGVILNQISARLAPGQIVGLVGPNGTGKSTLVNAIATLCPFSGQICWKGEPVRLAEIGYMPQQCQVRSAISVTEAVLLGRHEGLGWRVSGALLDSALALLDSFGIGHLHDRGMHTLSGGQQQLVLLAQRLLRQPDLLLLDEATSALDVRHQMQVFERLRQYVTRTGALVVVAIHDLNLAARHADTLMLLHGGRIAGLGRFEDVMCEDALRTVYGIEAELLTARCGQSVVLPLRAITNC
ncbi:MAG: ABC transporter ATP-binding protein [Lautropia sp.]|nr:ABC transporter ATP-binding protein [Lautropia sp.]